VVYCQWFKNKSKKNKKINQKLLDLIKKMSIVVINCGTLSQDLTTKTKGKKMKTQKAYKIYGKRIMNNCANEWEPVATIQAPTMRQAMIEAENYIDGYIWQAGKFFVKHTAK
jgi:hypothetical protein